MPVPVLSSTHAGVPVFPTGTATSGNTPSARVTVASYRSPIARRTVSTSTCRTGNPSECVTIIRCPPTATSKVVSAAALMIRNRTRCPGLASRPVASAGILPLAR